MVKNERWNFSCDNLHALIVERATEWEKAGYPVTVCWQDNGMPAVIDNQVLISGSDFLGLPIPTKAENAPKEIPSCVNDVLMLVLERNSRKRQLTFIERSIKIGIEKPQPEWVNFLLETWVSTLILSSTVL